MSGTRDLSPSWRKLRTSPFISGNDSLARTSLRTHEDHLKERRSTVLACVNASLCFVPGCQAVVNNSNYCIITLIMPCSMSHIGQAHSQLSSHQCNVDTLRHRTHSLGPFAVLLYPCAVIGLLASSIGLSLPSQALVLNQRCSLPITSPLWLLRPINARHEIWVVKQKTYLFGCTVNFKPRVTLYQSKGQPQMSILT